MTKRKGFSEILGPHRGRRTKKTEAEDEVRAEEPSSEAAVPAELCTSRPAQAAPARTPNPPSAADLARPGFLERRGSWVCGGGALTAWILGVILAEHDAVGGAFVVSGFVLLLAAAFFSRVVKVGKEGIELAAHAGEAARTAPVREGDTLDEAKERTAEAVEAAVLSQTRPAVFGGLEASARASTRLRLMTGDQAEVNLLAAFNAWLQGQGYTVLGAELRQDRVRGDLVAERQGERLHVELRPAVENLRLSDSRAITARQPVQRRANERRALVFRRGVHIDADARDLLERASVELFSADPETGQVERL